MDKKVRELIEPFKNWDVTQLSFRTLMTTIDAIIESRNEKLKDELIQKIQKLQIEKTFPPKTTDEDENEDIDKEKPRKESKALEGEAIARLLAAMTSHCVIKTTDDTENKYKRIEDEYKCSIVDRLTNNFKSELKTLTNREYYNVASLFVNVPFFTTNSFYEYCHALKRKLDALINSVKTDYNSNAIYIARRQKTDPNYSIYFTKTIILFNPKECIVTKAPSFENSVNIINLTITDCKENINAFQLKYNSRYSIIEYYNNPNFMLFDPITGEYVLFYKSHNLLYTNYVNKNSTLLKNKDEDKKVNDEKVEIDEEFNDEKVEIDEDVNNEKSREKRAKMFGVFLKTEEDKRINTRNTLKELFSKAIMTITNEKEVNENFTYSKCDLQTLKKYIRKYIRNLICKIPDSEPLYIYSNLINNNYMTNLLTCYHVRNYQILPNDKTPTSNDYSFGINIDFIIGCIRHNVFIPITFFDGENTYFLSVRNKNKDPENKSYNFAIVNTKTKESVIFTKDKNVFDDWKLEITAKR